MSFRGIPDARLDPHPRLTWLIEMGFDVGVRALFRKQEIFPEHFKLEPGTLVVSNHQRDADVPIIGTTLCRRYGWRFRWPLTFFVAREDLFRSGFLTEYFPGWPGRLLGWVRLKWFFEAARAYPIRRVREFSLAEVVDALTGAGLGAEEPGAVFNARGRRELEAVLEHRPARVADLDRRRLRGPRRWGLRRLRLDCLRRIAPQFRDTVQAQLEGFTRRLDTDRVVYISPEGVISETGRFGRVRLGARWLYTHAEQPPAVLPVALSYDALVPGKCRVIVHVGRAVRGLEASSEAAFAAELRRLILELYMVNPSHLLACFLTAGPEHFSAHELQAWLARRVDYLRQHAIVTDPLLMGTPLAAVCEQRLRVLQRLGLIARDHGGWRNRMDRGAAPGWQGPSNVVRYLDNALGDIAPALAQVAGP